MACCFIRFFDMWCVATVVKNKELGLWDIGGKTLGRCRRDDRVLSAPKYDGRAGDVLKLAMECIKVGRSDIARRLLVGVKGIGLIECSQCRAR